TTWSARSPGTGTTPVSTSATPTPSPVLPACQSLSAPITRATSVTVVAELSNRQWPCGCADAVPGAAPAAAGPKTAPATSATVAEETTHNGIVDPLTGAYSRALLFPRLAEELSRAARSTTGFAVMLFDVDYFKSVNDAYGHSRGDEVLRQLAERVGQLVRGYDVLFRYGGDEFVLLLPDTGEADAVRVALRLTEGVRGTPFPGEPPLSVSVSLGVAMFPKDADRAEDLLACADRRNYLAKQRGR